MLFSVECNTVGHCGIAVSAVYLTISAGKMPTPQQVMLCFSKLRSAIKAKIAQVCVLGW